MKQLTKDLALALGFGTLCAGILLLLIVYGSCYIRGTSTVTLYINYFGEGAAECWLLAFGLPCALYYLASGRTRARAPS